MDGKLLFILPLAVALFWIVRIFLLKNVNRVQLLIVGAMTMAVMSVWFRGFTLMVFPFVFLAVRLVTAVKGLSKWDALTFILSLSFLPLWEQTVGKVFLAVQVLAVSVWSLASIRIHFRRMAELYDLDNENISADDIEQVVLFIIFSAITFSIVLFVPDAVGDSLVLQAVLAGFLAVLQYYIGKYTCRIKDTSSVTAELAELAAEAADEAEAEKSAYSDDRLIRRVEEEKLYLDPSLSLVSLSEMLHTNRTYLSASIHACRNQNFSEFINALRVEYFMDIVRKEPGINVKEAAMRSGYNNLQSFYRHFSEIMEMTPKTWISKQLNR